MKRHCCNCGQMTKNWQKVNGSPWHCYDGCYSTTGLDRRSPDGQPIWLKTPDPATSSLTSKDAS